MSWSVSPSSLSEPASLPSVSALRPPGLALLPPPPRLAAPGRAPRPLPRLGGLGDREVSAVCSSDDETDAISSSGCECGLGFAPKFAKARSRASWRLDTVGTPKTEVNGGQKHGAMADVLESMQLQNISTRWHNNLLQHKGRRTNTVTKNIARLHAIFF